MLASPSSRGPCLGRVVSRPGLQRACQWRCAPADCLRPLIAERFPGAGRLATNRERRGRARFVSTNVRWGLARGTSLGQIKGDRDVLLGKLQEYYGKSRDEAGRR
jgi:hypothetical protein